MKTFNIRDNVWLIHILAIGILFLCEFERYFIHSSILYDDNFHYGEFVSLLPTILSGKLNFFTIHGAMDWLPAWLAQCATDTESHFLLTMFIYHSLSAVSGLLLYMIVAQNIKLGDRYFFIVLLATVTLATYVVGYRDVFLLASIWLFIYQKNVNQQAIKSHFIAAMLGATVAINVAWSFDRGIAGIAGIGFTCLILGMFEKQFLVTIVSSALTLYFLFYIGILPHNYFDNVRFLLDTASQWSLGYSTPEPIILTFIVLVPNVVALYVLGNKLRKMIIVNRKEAAYLLMLFILTIFMFKIGTGRADPVHIDMSLWMPLLSFLYLSKDYLSLNKTIPVSNFILVPPTLTVLIYSGNYPLFILSVIPPILYFIEARNPALGARLASNRIAFLILLMTIVVAKVVKVDSHVQHGEYSWLSGLFNPPRNELLVDHQVGWVASELLNVHSNCVFDLTNSGVINGIAGLPSCTKFAYPIYATQQYEGDMLQQLEQAQPPAVVSSFSPLSPWDNELDRRFPRLRAYLIKTYPFSKCNFGYCLRYIHRPE